MWYSSKAQAVLMFSFVPTNTKGTMPWSNTHRLEIQNQTRKLFKKKKIKNTKFKKQKTFQHGSLNIPGVIYTLKQNIKEQTNKSRSVLGQGHKCSAMNDKTRQEAMEPQRGGLGFGFGLGWGVVASGRRAPTVHSPLCCWRCRPRLPPACLPPPGEVFCRCLPRSGPVPHLTCPRSPE